MSPAAIFTSFLLLLSAASSAALGGVYASAGARVIRVRKDGRGDFGTVGEALESIPEGGGRRWVVAIGGGEYWEKITVGRRKPYVTLYGKAWDKPVINYNGTAADYGTVNSATFAVESEYFVAVNIVFKNSAPEPDGKRRGAQAVALRISGDKAAFYGCKFIGFQDTLCDDRGRHFFHKCHIQGTVDFIFGNGRSIYMDTTIKSVARRTGVITAQGRDKPEDSGGYTFVRCNITGSGRVLLGRAWRRRSRVVIAHSYMGGLVDPPGWSDFGQPGRDRTVFYGEYKNWGPGADMSRRVDYARRLSDEEARRFLRAGFIDGTAWINPPP
uniref:Pectinesterase n=1 Tax=Kalanchoe fedtschenkoi TaxID=63787 RepID=A0A7N0SWU7_KALFE